MSFLLLHKNDFSVLVFIPFKAYNPLSSLHLCSWAGFSVDQEPLNREGKQ